ncbi:MAG: methyl-accepting chemotaxis protein [Lachnospiraceae bacterium]|nr:methyl-accepting chemotaxis protein [Lachnospiraceae bacterium]
MKLSMRQALSCFIVPMVAVLVIVAMFFAYRMDRQGTEDKELYYDTLYQINTTLINADRDFYQAMLAAEEIKAGSSGEDTATLLGDYEDNKQQTIDGVKKAIEIAKANEDLWVGTKAEDGSTFEAMSGAFERGVATWESTYDVANGTGDWAAFETEFSLTRGCMNTMQELTETWADAEIAKAQEATQTFVTVSFGFLILLSALILVGAMFIANKMVKTLKEITAGIENMRSGDFVTEVSIKSVIREFLQIGEYTEEMRAKVQSVLIDVVGGAESVNTSAEMAKDGISGCRVTTTDISSAVNDLAQGATTMAEDVQNATGITVDIGDAVDRVMNAASDNLNRGTALYDESTKVQHQLLEIQKQDAETDAMAGNVADSVNETAEVVAQISTAAESIISIASQTNLLALNASIEAARAGEAGKGFAVVADNIKGLAEETNEMAEKITDMLSTIAQFSENNKKMTARIKEATGNESEALTEMVASFDEMLRLLNETEQGNKAIMDLVDNLNIGKSNVMNSMESLSSISEENAASTEETSASIIQLENTMHNIADEADKLSDVARNLQENIQFFRV